MAATFQVNLNIKAGTSFSHDFSLTNSDLSPKNITGWKFQARMAKHSSAIDAMLSSSKRKVGKYAPFICNVKDGNKGVYNIYMGAAMTSKLPEGKYVYSDVGTDLNGNVSEMVSGLIFVEVAIGAADIEVIFDGGGAAESGDTLIINGGTSSGF